VADDERWFESFAKGHQLACRAGGAARRTRYIGRLHALIDQCESPAEQLLALGLCWWEGGFELLAQVPVASSRIDFVIRSGSVSLGIEVDGHDFHERTKEQAQRDKACDRRLLSVGYPIVRFTGSEVYADPYLAAAEAFDVLESLAGERIAS